MSFFNVLIYNVICISKQEEKVLRSEIQALQTY